METGKLKVTKSNHLVEASYRLPLEEQRLLLFLIAQVEPHKPFPKSFKVSALEYADLFGLDRKSAYGQLNKAAKGLMGRQVKTNDPKAKVREWINWMDRCVYHDGEGFIEASFNYSVTPYLHRLAKQFTSYRLEVVSRVRSAYAIRLYELLIQFRDTGERYLKIDKFRDMLQVDSKYPRFVDLKRRVIEPAVKEINMRTEILVTWEPHKAGRHVQGLRFHFAENPQKKMPL